MRSPVPQSSTESSPLPFWALDQLPPSKDGIVPLQSNALALRFATLRPGPDLAMRRPEQEAAQSELLRPRGGVDRQ